MKALRLGWRTDATGIVRQSAWSSLCVPIQTSLFCLLQRGMPMTIRGLNHITLATTDLVRACAFYTDALGLKLQHLWDDGAYLSAGSLWLCLAVDDHVNRVTDYTHVAFDIAPEDFATTCACLVRHGAQEWKQNRSEGDSFYFTDPDGHRLELHVGNLVSRLAHISEQTVKRRPECGI